jgi:hypothetical protein
MASDPGHSRSGVTSAASQDCGQPLSDMTRCRFLELPLELRLSIYHSIVRTGLDENESRDIRSALLSCRQIHREMEDEYISKARPFLNAMHSWKTTSEETKLLRMRFKICPTFAESMRTPTIEIPTTVFPEKDRKIARALHPVFCLPHSTLTIRIIGHSSHDLLRYEDQLYRAAYCVRGFDKNSPSFRQTKRLILRFTPPKDVDIRSSFNFLCVSMFSKIVFPNSVPPPIPMRTWAAEEIVEGKQQMVYYGFDFEEGLPEFPGSRQRWNRSDWPESLK